MITITKVHDTTETKLSGEIDSEKYCISYTDEIYAKLQELSNKLDTCETFDDWSNVIVEAKALVDNKPFSLPNSKYFVKRNGEFYITNGKKYYNVGGTNGLLHKTLSYYSDKQLNIDKFAIFVARRGDSSLLKMPNIYHKINNNGNLFLNCIPSGITCYNTTFRIKDNKVVAEQSTKGRYFLRNNIMLKSNAEYTLKSLEMTVPDIITLEDKSSDDAIPMLIKPDLKCFIGDLETNGLIIDPDDEIDWEGVLMSFIDTYGTRH